VSARSHEDYKDNIGAYVLGALPELETELLERHLDTCASCRAEVEELRPVTAALDRSVPQMDAPPSLKASLMAVVNAEAAARAGAAAPEEGRRRRSFAEWVASLRPRTAVAAALAVLALGIVVGIGVSQLAGGGGTSTKTIAAKIDRTRLPTGNASLELSGRTGTLDLTNAPQPPAGRVYQLWYQHGKTIVRGGTFRPLPDGSYRATVPVGGASAVMITVEHEGGAPAPTGPPVMQFNT
jgi:anti-sigma-K factor RskA